METDDFSGFHWFMLFYWCREVYNTTCSVSGCGSAVGHQSCWLVRAEGCVYVAVISNCAALTECIILIMRDYTHTHGDFTVMSTKHNTGFQSGLIILKKKDWFNSTSLRCFVVYFCLFSCIFSGILEGLKVIQNFVTKRWTDQVWPSCGSSLSCGMCINDTSHTSTPGDLENILRLNSDQVQSLFCEFWLSWQQTSSGFWESRGNPPTAGHLWHTGSLTLPH